VRERERERERERIEIRFDTAVTPNLNLNLKSCQCYRTLPYIIVRAKKKFYTFNGKKRNLGKSVRMGIGYAPSYGKTVNFVKL
jgi:hypothetical protein